jgi:putative Mg2+ transporter-C (MgtC) family protein
MPESIWPYFGDIHTVVPPHWAGVLVTLASVVCGGIIGIERQRAQKPVGMRTLILICLGSTIFTQASILMAQNGDRTRIASQIVSGIGFLGAGAIIRERGLIIGVTTAAGIWATAAVGVVIGTGHIAAGCFFSLLIFAVLALAKLIDRIALGPCRYKTLHLEFDPNGGKTRIAIRTILEEHQHQIEARFDDGPEAEGRASIRYCDSHHEHHVFLSDLLQLPAITRLMGD